MRDPDDAQVTYTVKELLEQIHRTQSEGFTKLETAMSGKADAAHVARIEERLDHTAGRVSKVEQKLAGHDERRYTVKAIVGAVGTTFIALGGLGAFLAAVHVL